MEASEASDTGSILVGATFYCFNALSIKQGIFILHFLKHFLKLFPAKGFAKSFVESNFPLYIYFKKNQLKIEPISFTPVHIAKTLTILFAFSFKECI